MESGNNQSVKRIVDYYELTDELGKGKFGETFLARNTKDNKYYAAKKLKKIDFIDPNTQQINQKKMEFFNRELAILKKLNGNDNIVHFYELKETNNSYYIINELANGGGIKQILKKYKEIYHRPFEEEIVQHLMKQICHAISYVHKLGIIHRDLKLDNILIHYPNEIDKANMNLMAAQVKIIDFGLSIDLSSGDEALTLVGTYVNQAPTLLEQLDGIKVGQPYDNKVDIWSLGTICYEMLVGELPFQGRTIKELIDIVSKGVYEVPYDISKEAFDFIKAMLKKEGAKRKSANELLRMPFLIKNVRDFKPLKSK